MLLDAPHGEVVPVKVMLHVPPAQVIGALASSATVMAPWTTPLAGIAGAPGSMPF
jgi:hypothetical protein